MMKREERITKPRQYAEVYGKGKSYPSELIVLRTLPNNLDYSRYGISVSKKVGNAVTRNKLKRRLREINRIESIMPGWDMVYILRPSAAQASFTSLKETVELLLTKADILKRI
jgi:ribonuclease P protein component